MKESRVLFWMRDFFVFPHELCLGIFILYTILC